MSSQDTSSDPPIRLFSLQEANALLPRVGAIVARLQEIFEQFRQFAKEQPYPAALERSNGHPLPESPAVVASASEVQALRTEAEALVEEIIGMGVALKDVDQGLVDFPAVHDGRVVYLCWKQGEDEIRFWHDLDTGFAGRQPL